jgi:hypothetical protein
MNQKIWLVVLFSHKKTCPIKDRKKRNMVAETTKEEYLSLVGRQKQFRRRELNSP